MNKRSVDGLGPDDVSQDLGRNCPMTIYGGSFKRDLLRRVCHLCQNR